MNVAIKQLSQHKTEVLGQRLVKPAPGDFPGKQSARDSKCLHKGNHCPAAVPTPEKN